MKIIGSKMAVEIARKRWGRGAFAMRQDKEFIVGDTILGLNRSRGKGKSWALAVENAGLEIPIRIKAVSPYTLPDYLPDTMPEDDDPIVVEKLGSPDEEE